jgi:hypothetical protein
MDFYLSDQARQGWDNLLTNAETILEGNFVRREQVVHWVRSFPFAFLSDRSYVIARRMFEQDGKLYGISKVIKFPGHDSGRTVRMDNYWSMWSCEAAPCPFGTGMHWHCYFLETISDPLAQSQKCGLQIATHMCPNTRQVDRLDLCQACVAMQLWIVNLQ